MTGLASGDSAVDGLVILSRFVHFAALCHLTGRALFALTVAPMPPTRGRAVAAVLAVISALGWLAAVAAEMSGGWAELLAPDTVGAVLTETRFGRLWCLRLALLAAALATALMQPGRRSDLLTLWLAGAALASLAGAGHGLAGSGSLWIAHVIADAIHLLCAAVWLGGLASLAMLLRSHWTSGEAGSPAGLGAALTRFSRLGYAAVAALVLTGCVNTALVLPAPELLLTSEYGRVLLVKLMLVAAMVAIAAANRLVLAPPLRRGAAVDDVRLRALRCSVAVEQATGLAVLAVVALLGTIDPGH